MSLRLLLQALQVGDDRLQLALGNRAVALRLGGERFGTAIASRSNDHDLIAQLTHFHRLPL
jgi:hypothetical protein